jgi:hypothetical protein
MISVLVLSVADRGFEPRSGQPKTMQLVCVASLLRAKIGWLGIRIMCPSGATCLCMDCCFSELALYISNHACWSSTKRTLSSSH